MPLSHPLNEIEAMSSEQISEETVSNVQDARAPTSPRRSSIEPTFEEYVEDARKNRRNWDIPHACSEEALFVVRALIADAHNNPNKLRPICSVARNYPSNFFDALKDDIDLALDAGVFVTAIVLSPGVVISDNVFLNTIGRHVNGEVITQIGNEILSSPSFIVVGNFSYRFRIRSGEAKALANFNNQFIGDFLVDQFHTLRDQLKPSRPTSTRP